MNKTQADIEAKRIFQEANQKAEEIIKTAKRDGKWNTGLDGNRAVFNELNKETKEKVLHLHSLICKE